jgi:hypothetical protein
MEEDKAFNVRDRRSYLSGEAEGETSAKKSAEKEPSAEEKKQPAQAASREEAPPGKMAEEQAEGTFPVNFSSFILSLATSALIHLGEEANPATGEKSVQLPMARQVIDLLSLLEEKTKGNLTKEEEALISQVLFTLRMRFVETEKKRRP